jgi:hypothetical protein
MWGTTSVEPSTVQTLPAKMHFMIQEASFKYTRFRRCFEMLVLLKHWTVRQILYTFYLFQGFI